VTPLDAAALAAAGFAAGAINAVAGGGSLVSFPTLIATGLGPLSANVTNTVAIWPGYLSSTASFRKELEGQSAVVRSLGLTALFGAAGGAALLLGLPDRVFRQVVPWLVLASSLLLAVQPRLAARLRAGVDRDNVHRGAALHISVLFAAAYGAYFGGGLGVILLAVLGVFLPDALHRTNGLKAALSLVINTVALVAFVTFGPISWPSFAVLAPASFLGGTAGARVTRRLDPAWLRATIVVAGVIAAAVLFIRF